MQDRRRALAPAREGTAGDGAFQRRAAGLLGVVGIASLGLTTAVNRWVGAWLRAYAPDFAWLAAATVPSLLVSLAVYLAIRPRRALALPAPGTAWGRIWRLGALWLTVWLAGSELLALSRGQWVAYAHGAASVAAFLVIAPLAEELLFRGAIFELAERSIPRVPAAPVIISSVCFSLQHFQMHGFHATGAALGQVAFTFPMGLVFGNIRRRSQSLWPGVGLHVLTNLPGAFGA